MRNEGKRHPQKGEKLRLFVWRRSGRERSKDGVTGKKTKELDTKKGGPWSKEKVGSAL